jgi:TolB protein
LLFVAGLLATAAWLPQNPTPAQAPGAPVRLTYVVHAYANWSPDDRKLAFQSNANGNWDLFVVGVDGEGLTPIVTDKGHDITPVYSPDGRRIAFVSERDGNREVYMCAADGSDQRRLTNNPAADIHPVWSADGARIMFSSNRGNTNLEDYDIYTMAADGSDVRQVTRGPDVDTYSSWSPDASRIITRRVVGGNNEVFVMNADGGGAVNLTNNPSAYDGWPVWSPDGKRVAFASGPGGRSPHRIYVMDADGKNVRAMTDAPPGSSFVYDTQPCFSHDGRRLAFTRYHPTPKESAEICILTLAGGA